MNGPLVSVVIPCYNGAAFLKQCIQSVLEQKTNCEIIVVDDGSTDNSVEQARMLLRDYSTGMVLISQQNQGPAVARNTGLRMAEGKYVCFLDVDDQYAPGFFSSALKVLESNPAILAVSCQIELVNAHREVEPWQRETIEQSLASNVLLRTETAREIGGFPTYPAFRGQAAGEDITFRRQLLAQGNNMKIPQPLFKYLVRPGSHFDFFLDRARRRDGRVELSYLSQEEMDGSFAAAVRQYEQSVHQRAITRTIKLLGTAVDAGLKCQLLSRQFESVEGFLSPFEGFVLYWLAKFWPVNGRAVEIGSFKGRSTCWLAAGSKEGNKGKVAAVDHFCGSADHQRGSSHEDRDVAASGSTLAVFQGNLQRLGLADWVTTHVSSSADASSSWREPIRLLFIDGDHSYESASQDFLSWSRFVVQHGLVLFHDIGVFPGVTQFFNKLSSQQEHWRVVARLHTLGLLERLA